MFKRKKGMNKKFLIFFILPLISFSLFFVFMFSAVYTIVSNNKSREDVAEYFESGKLKIPQHYIDKYKPLITKEAKKQGLDLKYIDLLLAQAMQESSFTEPDIFCASESKYNGQIGLIKSVEESIEQVIKRYKEIMADISKVNLTYSIDLLLQTYNYGSGYLTYVKNHGGKHTLDIAKAFSSYQAKKMGWKKYGDPLYVDHIKRYIEIASSKVDITMGFIKGGNYPPPDPNHRAKNTTAVPGQCTWYVFNRFSQLGKPIPIATMGNGGDWWKTALRNGIPISHTAKAGTAICFPKGVAGASSIGHIAFVEKVNNDGSLIISEMNFKGPFIINMRTIKKEDVPKCWYIDFGLR